MMAGNPNGWWSMQSELRSTSDQHHHHHHEQEAHNNLFISQTHPSNNNNSILPVHHHHHHQQQQFLHGSSSSTSPSSPLVPFISLLDPHHGQDFPHSWSQLLLGGMASEQEEERFSTTPPPSHFQSTRVMNNDVKPEVNTPSNNSNNNLYENHQYHHEDHDQQQEGSSSVGISNNNNRAWSTQLMPVSSPKSCITSLNNNNNNINTNDNNNININININSSSNNNNNGMLDFSTNKRALQAETHQHADHSNSECNSTATGGLPKKPRLQSSSNPPLKVRKEKLGDRITSLHQLVSPFGKTDTASVLLEAIGYIRFLQSQIEALSSPYLGSDTSSVNNTHSIHGERTCLFPDHPGQLLNDSCLKRRGAANQEDKQAARKDLKSRGLCLVPISCTHLIGSENGADYWAQSLGGGF